jgi:hypothetical protein
VIRCGTAPAAAHLPGVYPNRPCVGCPSGPAHVRARRTLCYALLLNPGTSAEAVPNGGYARFDCTERWYGVQRHQ